MPKERQSAEASKIVKRLPATECRRYALSSNFPLPQISHPFLLAFRLIPPHRTESTQWFLFVHPTSRFIDFKIQKPNNKHRSSSYPFLLNTSTSAVTETARQRSVSSPHLIFTSPRCSTTLPRVTTVLLADPTPRVATNRPATKRKESSVIYAAKSKNLCLMIA